MIKNENNDHKSSQLTSILNILFTVCTKLNGLLPSSQQVEITTSIESLTNGLNKITDMIVISMQGYQKHLQNLEDNLRKHIKNEIQLKLYYEYLEQVVTGLKKQKNNDKELITSLKTELSQMKEKEKYYMTLSNNNTTKNNEDNGVIDIITKIKNRLSLSNTGQFYASYATKKINKEHETLELRDKRESLAQALKQLYDSPVQQQSGKSIKKQLKKNSKPKQRNKSKQKSSQHGQSSRNSLNKSKSGKSLTQTHQHVRNTYKQKGPSQPHNGKKEKDFYKLTYSAASSRRSSKA